jgi:hypothetical protein
MRLGFLRHRGRIADLAKLEAGQLPLDTAVVIDVQRGGLAFIGRRAWVALRPRVGRRRPADARAPVAYGVRYSRTRCLRRGLVLAPERRVPLCGASSAVALRYTSTTNRPEGCRLNAGLRTVWPPGMGSKGRASLSSGERQCAVRALAAPART